GEHHIEMDLVLAVIDEALAQVDVAGAVVGAGDAERDSISRKGLEGPIQRFAQNAGSGPFVGGVHGDASKPDDGLAHLLEDHEAGQTPSLAQAQVAGIRRGALGLVFLGRPGSYEALVARQALDAHDLGDIVGGQRDQHNQLRLVFFSTEEKLIIGSPPVEMMPRTKTMLRPAFTTSPVHSTSSPTRAVPTNSPLKVAVTQRLSWMASRAIQNKQKSAKVMTQPPCMNMPPFMCLCSARKAQTAWPFSSVRQ